MDLIKCIDYINKSADKPRNSEKIKELSKGQHPDITLITCSDSRLKLEQEMDLGKIFTIREMGSILNNSSIASIEYSILINVKKILFVSHTNCGAIKAAFKLLDINSNAEKEEILKSKFLTEFIEANIINPLNLHYNDNLNEIIIKNEEIQIEKLLKESPMIENKLKENKIEIATAQYSTETGKIKLLKNCIYKNEKIIFITNKEHNILSETNDQIKSNKVKTKIV